MKITQVTLAALLYGAQALAIDHSGSNALQTLSQTRSSAQVEGRKKKKSKRYKPEPECPCTHPVCPQPVKCKEKLSCSESTHSEKCSSSDVCDIVLAHGYSEIYASSSLDTTPFNYFNPKVYVSSDDEKKYDVIAKQFAGIGCLEGFNGPDHNNLCIGQYGSCTLRPEKDIMKRVGSTDGFFFDWLCKDFGSYRSCSDSHGRSATDKDNANREYLDVRFPCLHEIKSIRIQGIRNIEIGGRDSSDAPPRKIRQNLYSKVQKFEVWCNTGYNWKTVSALSGKWSDAEKLLDLTNTASDCNEFAKVRKFSTGLTNYHDIANIQLPPGQQCLEVRVVFNEYRGNALGTKLGIGIVDKDGDVCKRECPEGCHEKKKPKTCKATKNIWY